MGTSGLLKEVRHTGIKTRGLSRNAFTGQYYSAFKGRGVTFSEVREYQYGDDIQDIDWDMTVRYVRLYVRVFEKEREPAMMLLIDVSDSRDFGSINAMKEGMVAGIATILVFSAIQGNDKIGMVFLLGRVEKLIPPQKRKRHILHIIWELIDFHPKEARTGINQVLRYLTNAIKKRCTAFFISDLIDKEGLKSVLTTASRKHDMVTIRIYGRRKTKLPVVGLMKIKNTEVRRGRWIDDSSTHVYTAYKKWWGERQAKIGDTFRKYRVNSMSVRTEDDYVRVLIALFDKRN